MSDNTQPASIDVFRDLRTSYSKGGAGERIFALMGPNGAGKTRLLQSIEHQCRDQKIFVLPIRAHRALSPSVPVEALPSATGPVGMTAVLQRNIDLTSAVFWEVDSIFKSVEPRREKWKDDLATYHEQGEKGIRPQIPVNQIESLQNVLDDVLGYKSTVFKIPPQPHPHAAAQATKPGHRRLTGQTAATSAIPMLPARPEIRFTRGNIPFESGALSDGEKQILMLAWMLIEHNAQGCVFLVDEPELYLNEARAIEFWEKLENHFPRAVFLYATHNIVFATRQKVDRTYLMGMDQKLEVLPSDEPLPQSVVREMVGARVQILRTSKPIIFCEDTLLRQIASDILPSDEFDFVILGGHHSVVAAVASEHRSWSMIRSSLPHCGIIDRDARDDNDVATMAKKNVFCFPLFEAESLIADPFVAAHILSLKLRREVSVDEYLPLLYEAAIHSRKITLLALEAHLSQWFRTSLKYDDDGKVISNVELVPPQKLAERFEQRAKEIQEALENKNPDSITKLFDGKQLCTQMANRSHAAFGVDFGADPESDYELFRRSDQRDIKLGARPELSDWAKIIRSHLAAKT